MTPDELKFALRVETVLNSLPDPEFRQMVVEVLMVIGLVVKCSEISSLGDTIVAEHIIGHAHSLFLQDQASRAGEGSAVHATPTQYRPHPHNIGHTHSMLKEPHV